jgi:hypothetical protein
MRTIWPNPSDQVSFRLIATGDCYTSLVCVREANVAKKCPHRTGRMSRCRAETLEPISLAMHAQCSYLGGSCLVKTAHSLFADCRAVATPRRRN